MLLVVLDLNPVSELVLNSVNVMVSLLRHNHVKMHPVRRGEAGQNGQSVQLHVKLVVKEDIDNVFMVTIVIPKAFHHLN